MKDHEDESVNLDSIEIYSRKDAASLLRVSISFLDNCTKETIPRVKIGRRTMYLKSDLIDFILSNKTLGGKKCKTKSQLIQEQLKKQGHSNQ